MLARGLHGLVPELLGLSPGRRIVLLVAENVLLVENHGDVSVRTNLPGWCPVLLRIVGRGDASKGAIVHGLWGLRACRPERHDALVRTTVHRLRSLLAPFGAWIRVTEHGYGSTVPVLAVGVAASHEPSESELDMLGPWDRVSVAPAPSMAAEAPRRASPVAQVLDLLSRAEALSVPELTRALGVSRSTVLRALRPLAAQKQIVRTGHARATRYRLRAV